jgi:hypothetical protein
MESGENQSQQPDPASESQSSSSPNQSPAPAAETGSSAPQKAALYPGQYPVRFKDSDKPCRITLVHDNGTVDVEEMVEANDEATAKLTTGRWFQNVSADQIAAWDGEA